MGNLINYIILQLVICRLLVYSYVIISECISHCTESGSGQTLSKSDDVKPDVKRMVVVKVDVLLMN